MAAVRHFDLFYACIGHWTTQRDRVVGRLHLSATFGCNRQCSCEDVSFLFQLGFKNANSRHLGGARTLVVFLS